MICPYCVRGSWTDSNGQNRRCYFCKGTSQVPDPKPAPVQEKAA